MAEFLAFSASALGLVFGIFLGLSALIRPRWSDSQMRTAVDNDPPGGVGEQRAFGGLLIGAHALPLVGVGFALNEALGGEAGPPIMGVVAFGMAFPIALAWLGAGLGRIGSIVIDRAGVAHNWRYVGVDLTLAALVGAPLLLLFR